MKKTALALCAALAALSVSACAARHDEVAVGVGVGPAYDAYYDDYYGPYYDGYWAPDGFYFSDADGHPYRHDDGNHFQRQASAGFHGIHSHPQPDAHRG